MENIKDYQQYLKGYNYTDKNGDIQRQVGGMPYQQLSALAEQIVD